MKPNEKEYIYTDEVDYKKTTDDSVWGTEDQITAETLKTITSGGNWLNLCAGDGRFNNLLLHQVDEVTAADIDESALEKLHRQTPQVLRTKLKIAVMNISETFPFEDNTFDGIFCVGTLHLFPVEIFKKICGEFERVLRKNGRIIVDFATDIRRTYSDGSLWIVENEPNYTLNEGIELLKKVFSGYTIKISTDSIEPEKVTLDDKEYMFTSNFILLDAKKK